MSRPLRNFLLAFAAVARTMIADHHESPIQERRASSFPRGRPLARLRRNAGQLLPAATSVGRGGGARIRGDFAPRELLGGRHPVASPRRARAARCGAHARGGGRRASVRGQDAALRSPLTSPLFRRESPCRIGPTNPSSGSSRRRSPRSRGRLTDRPPSRPPIARMARKPCPPRRAPTRSGP